LRQRSGEGLLQQRDVGRDAAVQLTHTATGEKDHGQGDKVIICRLSQQGQRLLRHLGEEVDAEIGEDGIQDENADEDEADPVDAFDGAMTGRIDEVAHEHGEDQNGQAGEDQEDHAAGKGATMGLHKTEETHQTLQTLTRDLFPGHFPGRIISMP